MTTTGFAGGCVFMAEELKKTKAPLSVGLLAHVDAGKTTLSEAMLYRSGAQISPGLHLLTG